MLELGYHAPAPPLRGLVSTYYLLRLDAPRLADQLPAELAQLRFLLRGAGTLRFDDVEVIVPRASLVGPTLRSVRFDLRGPATLFGIGVLPAGWATLFGFGADELADAVADLGGVIGTLADAAWARLAHAPDSAAMARVADALLLCLLRAAHPAAAWFTRAVDNWLTAERDPHVDDLVRATGLSARQVERMTNRVYGAPPKLLARKYRALQAAAALAREPALGWEAAAAGAFYDQPHFIREFRHFVGFTPAQFAADQPWLGKIALAKRLSAGGEAVGRLS